MPWDSVATRRSPGTATPASRSGRRAARSILIDPWFGNPRARRPADSVERCDLLLVTHGHGDHMGDAVALASRLRPAWPCIHEMSLWLARRLPGGGDAAIGMNKGGTVEVGGIAVTMTQRRPLGRRLEPGRRDDRSTSASRPASSSSWRTGSASTTPATPTSSATCASSASSTSPDLALLPIGGHYTMGPREAALAVELLGVDARHADPLRDVPDPGRHARTSCERRSPPAASDVTVHTPAPGETIGLTTPAEIAAQARVTPTTGFSYRRAVAADDRRVERTHRRLHRRSRRDRAGPRMGARVRHHGRVARAPT